MKYIKSVSEFNEEIKKDNVLVDFYADWCGPCQMLGQVLEEVEKESNIEIIKVNTDDFLSLERDYKIMSIPAIKLFSKGNIVKEKVGFMTKDEVLKFLEK